MKSNDIVANLISPITSRIAYVPNVFAVHEWSVPIMHAWSVSGLILGNAKQEGPHDVVITVSKDSLAVTNRQPSLLTLRPLTWLF